MDAFLNLSGFAGLRETTIEFFYFSKKRADSITIVIRRAVWLISPTALYLFLSVPYGSMNCGQ